MPYWANGQAGQPMGGEFEIQMPAPADQQAAEPMGEEYRSERGGAENCRGELRKKN